MREIIVGALAQNVDRQDRPLPSVGPVIEHLFKHLISEKTRRHYIGDGLRLFHRAMQKRIVVVTDAFGVARRGSKQQLSLTQQNVRRL